MTRNMGLLWVFGALAPILAACTQEQQNRISRIGVTFLEGDYRATYADGSHVKSWEVRDGKVTSEPDKGYYFFLDERGRRETLCSDTYRPYLHRGDPATLTGMGTQYHRFQASSVTDLFDSRTNKFHSAIGVHEVIP